MLLNLYFCKSTKVYALNILKVPKAKELIMQNGIFQNNVYYVNVLELLMHFNVTGGLTTFIVYLPGTL